jgi:hypothetical protein
LYFWLKRASFFATEAEFHRHDADNTMTRRPFAAIILVLPTECGQDCESEHEHWIWGRVTAASTYYRDTMPSIWAEKMLKILSNCTTGSETARDS